MKIKEIKALLIGKQISYFDTFNGSGDCFVIRHVENVGSSVRVRAEKNKGFGIFIPKEIIEPLCSEGIIEKKNSLDGCIIKETWKIF